MEHVQGENTSRLLVCGIGPMEDWCKKYIEDNGLKTVEMRGFVPNEEIKEIMAESDALILPTQWYEGFPMTILEAYSAGIPVICSDLGNVGSIVFDGVTGLKFRCDDPEDLFYKIEMFEDRPFVVEREIRKQFLAEENYQLLADIYKNLIGVIGKENANLM